MLLVLFFFNQYSYIILFLLIAFPFLNTSVTLFYLTLHSYILLWYELSKTFKTLLKSKHTLHKQDNFGKFIYQFRPETKSLIRKLDRILNKLYRLNLSLLFNETGAHAVMVIVVGNRHSDTSSNPGQD